MHVDRVLAVADAIESHVLPDLGFNMRMYNTPTTRDTPDRSGHNCRTVACIAGWTLALAKQSKTEWLQDISKLYLWHGFFMSAQSILDLTYDQACDLFSPVGCIGRYNHIDDKQAVRTLRHFAATQIIDFKIGANSAR